MKYKKAIQLIVSKEKTATEWKEFTKNLKLERDIQTNTVTTFMVEEFLKRVKEDKEKIIKQIKDWM